MEINKEELAEIISTTVEQAVNLAFVGIEDKIHTAIQLGASIGATSGAAAGAQAAMRAAERERKKYNKQLYDARYHNTKLLLKHYRALNAHYKHAVFNMNTAEAEDKSFSEIMAIMNSTIADETLYIESIKQSVVRTKIIMAHVNRMIEIYEGICSSTGKADDMRHWRVLYDLYISDTPLTADEIAEREKIDKRTVYKDINAAATDLTMLLFGVAGLEK